MPQGFKQRVKQRRSIAQRTSLTAQASLYLSPLVMLKRFTAFAIFFSLSLLCNGLHAQSAKAPAYSPQATETADVHIGILSYRGKVATLKRWQPLADYLSQQIPGHRFSIRPLSLGELESAVASQSVDFLLTNPGHYVTLEVKYGVSRIVTMQSRVQGQATTRFGAVILTSANHQSIHALEDLKNHSFMAVSQEAFGGFQMAWRELIQQGVDPFADFSQLRFAGFPQDDVLFAVHAGLVDAATVRSETLLKMVEEGWFSDSDFRILNRQTDSHLGHPLSTRLYPEWPLAKSAHTPINLASRVTQVLLSMDKQSPVARQSGVIGWTIPLDYSSVHNLLKELQIGPYQTSASTAFSVIISQHKSLILGSFFAILSLLIASIYIYHSNRKLQLSSRLLEREIRQKESSQQQLAEYQNTLEQRVQQRTHALEQANNSLSTAQATLHQLVYITHDTTLTHEQKLQQLLETCRQHYQVAIANLFKWVNGQAIACQFIGDPNLFPRPDTQHNLGCAESLIDQSESVIDIPDISTISRKDSACYPSTLKSYLATAVVVNGQTHCILEFADTQSREAHYTPWDHHILHVMAQWIGNEIERQQAASEREQHHNELARVSRLSAMGEIAAGLAHELNQPLTGAINYSSGSLRLVKQQQPPAPDLQEGIEKTLESASLAAQIISQLREFLQKGEAEKAPVSLNQLVHNITDLLGNEFKRQQVELSLELASHLPRVSVNAVQIEQVILNFLLNAIDAINEYTPSQRQIKITSYQQSSCLYLSVCDSGRGISEPEMDKLFNPFYTTKDEGMGVGLSISRNIIESHNGQISAYNQTTGGACFFFELPIEDDR